MKEQIWLPNVKYLWLSLNTYRHTLGMIDVKEMVAKCKFFLTFKNSTSIFSRILEYQFPYVLLPCSLRFKTHCL